MHLYRTTLLLGHSAAGAQSAGRAEPSEAALHTRCQAAAVDIRARDSSVDRLVYSRRQTDGETDGRRTGGNIGEGGVFQKCRRSSRSQLVSHSASCSKRLSPTPRVSLVCQSCFQQQIYVTSPIGLHLPTFSQILCSLFTVIGFHFSSYVCNFTEGWIYGFMARPLCPL